MSYEIYRRVNPSKKSSTFSILANIVKTRVISWPLTSFVDKCKSTAAMRTERARYFKCWSFAPPITNIVSLWKKSPIEIHQTDTQILWNLFSLYFKTMSLIPHNLRNIQEKKVFVFFLLTLDPPSHPARELSRVPLPIYCISSKSL